MDLPESARAAAQMRVVETSRSTNTELLAHVASEPASSWPAFSVLATDHQTGGHGRHGRVWDTPAGRCLAASVLVRPTGDAAAPEVWGWLPLVAGLAMVRTLADLGVPVGVKWPNDVLATEAATRPGKLVGILAELAQTAQGPAVVIGTGVNLTFTEEELPVPTASSLALCGVEDPDPDRVLASYLARLRDMIAALEGRARNQSEFSGADALREAVSEACLTLGRQVRVDTPAGIVRGKAVALDDGGRIVVQTPSGRTALAAGDVTHLRY